MAQRLVRAKAKIRDAGIGFSLPETRELPARLGAVLDGIYGAYTLGSERAVAAPEFQARQGTLREEALFLAQLVAAADFAAAGAAEALGLLALLLYCEARRPALFDDAAQFVPLLQQDTGRWRRELIAQAEQALWTAARLRAPGPLQIEAAIQSAHCQRLHGGATPWPHIAQLYATLVAQTGSVGAHLGHAVALAEAGEVQAGLRVLAALAPDRTRSHQPYWVALAHLQRLAGQNHHAALQQALGLTSDEAVRAFLRRDDSA